MKPVIQTNFNMSYLSVVFDEIGEEAQGEILANGKIVITLGYNCTWRSVVEQLTHELMEIYMLKNGFRLAPTNIPSEYEAIACVFHLNHDQFQLMIREVSKITANLSQLKLVWERLNKT